MRAHLASGTSKRAVMALQLTWRIIMKTAEEITGMDPQIKAAMQEACDRIAKGIPFTNEERERAAGEIARIREENAKIFGVQNVAVDAVRESRNP
jgi:hypothetical protein